MNNKHLRSLTQSSMFLVAGVAAFALALPACTAEENDTSDSGDGGAVGEGGGGGADDPLYAMMIQVYDPEDRTVYVSLSDTLDIASTRLDSAREFASVANMAAIDGNLLVSSGSKAEITKFEITNQQAWVKGQTVSFSSFSLIDNANFYYQFVVDSEHTILPFDGTKRVLWNPATMKIEKTLEDTSLVSQDETLTLEAGGNRNGVHYDASVMQAFFYHDSDWYDYGSMSHIVVYDEDTFEEKTIVNVPCPALSLATRDETGVTYFATWDLPTLSVTGAAPTNCVAKVSEAGELLDTIDVAAWTDGRMVNNFRYIGNGKAVANVLHHEEFGVNDPSELSTEVLDELWMSGPHWKLWLLDVEARKGEPVAGIDVEIGSGAQFAVLEGRTFVFLPYDDWGRTKGYELLKDGTAVEHFDTVGDVFKWVKVR